MTRKIFEEVLNNYKTMIGKRYTKAALTKVWNGVSQFIRKNLQQGKGVTINNLGTFTFSEWKVFVGNKTIETKRPTFVISEKLVQFYNLRTRLVYTTGKTPICVLNHITIACSIGASRQLVEDCVKEVTEAFLRLLSQNQDVEIPFCSIGNLSVRNKHVQMQFYDNFLKNTNNELCSNKELKTGEDLRLDVPCYTSSPLTNNEIAEDSVPENKVE